jgi:S-formylglutathione hydrolase FrmB
VHLFVFLLASRMVQIDVHSDLLSAFWKQPVSLYADVLLPDSYDADTTRRYPVLYWFFGYGGNYDSLARAAWGTWHSAFGQHDEAIIVFADPVLSYVYTEFANSANVGPWGDAFTNELVPYIDRSFRTAKRYVGGHSSGAWAALWQQINNPDLFDGAWAYAPDPVDFHDFTGPDLTMIPPGNFYERSPQDQYELMPKSRMTLRQMAQGDAGAIWIGQFLSFEAVFSPKASDGGAAQLFDRKTGAIDASVAAYWEANYDIAALVKARWPQIGPSLRGKIHLIVGTHDNFRLDSPARLFCNELDALDADAECTFVDGGSHWSILQSNGGYERHIIDEIFRTVAG